MIEAAVLGIMAADWYGSGLSSINIERLIMLMDMKCW